MNVTNTVISLLFFFCCIYYFKLLRSYSLYDHPSLYDSTRYVCGALNSLPTVCVLVLKSSEMQENECSANGLASEGSSIFRFLYTFDAIEYIQAFERTKKQFTSMKKSKLVFVDKNCSQNTLNE